MERIYTADREIDLTKQQAISDSVIVRRVSEEVYLLQ